MNLKSAFKSYLVCALWSSTDNSDESGGEPFDANYDLSDIAFSSLLSLRREFGDFVKYASGESFPDETENLLEKYCAEMGKNEWSAIEQFAHDFWLTRNGHGAGFWDRGLGKLGNELSEMAKTYGTSDVYLGDDGKIYFT